MIGLADDCDLLDLVVLARAVVDPASARGVAQVCETAQPQLSLGVLLGLQGVIRVTCILASWEYAM